MTPYEVERNRREMAIGEREIRRMVWRALVSILLLAACGAAAIWATGAGAQSSARAKAPRQNGAPSISITTAAPTANPNTTATACGTSPDTCGRSSGVPGALHLTGCEGYRITICAPSGQTITSGTVQIYYFSDFFVSNLWSRNKILDETVSASIATDCAGSTCRCVTFPDHPTNGLQGGWIYPSPSLVLSAGTTVATLVEAVCGS